MLKPPETQMANFDEVALQHLDALYRYAMSLTRNQAEAEDLVQETYLRALRASGRLRPDSNIKSWLFKILRNARLNQVRSPGHNTQELDDQSELSAEIPSTGSWAENPHASYVSARKQEDVRKAVAALPPAHREIIVLREFEDLSYEEIAQILSCRLGTVMSRLSRARETLRRLLQHWDERATDSQAETDERRARHDNDSRPGTKTAPA
jgi:RNA polymerase sigma-70 factor, ECF subfamily